MPGLRAAKRIPKLPWLATRLNLPRFPPSPEALGVLGVPPGARDVTFESGLDLIIVEPNSVTAPGFGPPHPELTGAPQRASLRLIEVERERRF